MVAIRRSWSGPHKAGLEVDLAIHESTVTLTYELRAGDPKLYVHFKGVWFQRGTPQTGVPVLRFAWPLALRGRALPQSAVVRVERARLEIAMPVA